MVRSDGYQYDPTKFANFVHIATNAGTQAIITVNYGTGTSNETADWVTNVKNNNHGFKYWEIGNECYGTWEADSNTYPYDPYTYAVRAAEYITLMKAGGSEHQDRRAGRHRRRQQRQRLLRHPAYNVRTGTYHSGWTPVVLTTMKSLGVTPDFLVYHVYPEYGTDNDQALLQASGNWAGDAANLRQMITDYVGTAEPTSSCFAPKTTPTPAPRQTIHQHCQRALSCRQSRPVDEDRVQQFYLVGFAKRPRHHRR